MRAALHIQHRRPNDWAYRAPNWKTHSLGQWVELMGVVDPECAWMRALRAQTCAQPYTSSIDGKTTRPIEPQIGRSLGQWVELMGVGDHECALMCKLRAQTCAYYYTFSIGGQTAGPTGAQIGTNTHWNTGHKLWWSAVASAHWCARNRARSITHTALAPNGLDRLTPKLVQKPIGAMGTSYGGGAADPRECGARQRVRSTIVQGWNRVQQLPRVRSSSVGRALRAYRA
jgi:hypothetical protein